MLRNNAAYSRLPDQDSQAFAIELSEGYGIPKLNPAAEPLQTNDGSSALPRRSKSSEPSRLKSQFSGWRFGVTASAVLMFSVLVVNIVFTIWAVSTYKTSGGVGTMQTGSCQRTRVLSTWLHLAINILSTAMLSGSNYCG